MQNLNHITILGITLEPVAMADGTLLFVHRNGADCCITVVAAQDIFHYIGSGSCDHALAVLPDTASVEEWLHQNYPEPTFPTNIIFGNQASRAYDDGEIDLPGEDEEAEEEYLPHTVEEYQQFAEDNDGGFVRHVWKTKAERDAYYTGIQDGDGWHRCSMVDENLIKK